MKNTNENNFPTNGNCKRVRDLTTGKEYGSITETAITIGVTYQAVSMAIKNEGLCKGHRLILVKDLHDNIDILCEENAKANRRAAKAEAKIAKMETEMAEYRKWKAEQERVRKEEETKAKTICAAEKEVLKYEKKCQFAEAKCTYFQAQLDKNTDMLLKAQEKLRILKGGEA